MGWNSWNCFAGAVTAEHVKSAADAMVKSGLINHGWTYINIDDLLGGQSPPAPTTPRSKARCGTRRAGFCPTRVSRT